MASTIRTYMLAFLGFAFAMFGIIQAVDSYPSPATVNHFTDALPTLTAVFSFAFGVVGAIIGLALLLPSLYRLRRRRPNHSLHGAPQGMFGDRRIAGPRPVPMHHEGFDNNPDAYEGDDYGSGADGEYAHAYGNRHHDNGQFDQRRWAGSRR
ncbi:MAG TPA: hypothetical protein VFE47_10310 [Tepidisphaeraceae bacterium]|jgi:hypothetical protein|nr:hypothetical protein [Tepidisphaeraceae bacterium]